MELKDNDIYRMVAVIDAQLMCGLKGNIWSKPCQNGISSMSYKRREGKTWRKIT